MCNRTWAGVARSARPRELLLFDFGIVNDYEAQGNAWTISMTFFPGDDNTRGRSKVLN